MQTALPRYAVLRHRQDGDEKKSMVLALTRSRREARRIVISASARRQRLNEFYTVIDGPRSAVSDEVCVVGACCHASFDVVSLRDDDGPVLMPVELARMYEGDEDVVFLTDNRSRSTEEPEDNQE